MVRHNLDITYTIVWSLALANVVGAGLCIFLANPIARLTTIRFTLVAPFLFMVIAFAAFQSRQSLGDLVALMGIGLIGIFLRRFEFSRPAFLIGFVLSHQAEAFSNQVYQIAGSRLRRGGLDGMLEYVASPLVLAILVLTALSIWIGIRQGKHVLGNSAPPTGAKRAPVLFMLAITAYLAIAVWDAFNIRYTGDKVFPLTVGIATLIGCAFLLLRMRSAPEGDAIFADNEQGGEDAEAPHGLWSTLAWFAALLALSALLGFIFALAIFLVAFFRIRARVSWGRTLGLSAAGIALICALAGTLGRDFPAGLLQEYVTLPWPFT
jgi:hypothetical protein